MCLNSHLFDSTSSHVVVVTNYFRFNGCEVRIVELIIELRRFAPLPCTVYLVGAKNSPNVVGPFFLPTFLTVSLLKTPKK